MQTARSCCLRVDPHINNDNITISDEKKITQANYTNYASLTISKTGKIHSEKVFFNTAQYDEINKTYLAIVNIDGGVFSAYSLGPSSGDFRNYGYLNITNGGLFENSDNSTFYCEKDAVEYSGLKPRTTLDNESVFNNYSNATYKNLSGGDTYIQNKSTFNNYGTVLNGAGAYFKLDTNSIFENNKAFTNNDTLKIFVGSKFNNNATFTNTGNITVNSASLYNKGTSAKFISSENTLALEDSAVFENINGAQFSIEGGKLDMSGVSTFRNSSSVQVSGSGGINVHDQHTSGGQLSFQNAGTMNFSENSTLSISAGNNINEISATMTFAGLSKFNFSGGIFTNGQSVEFKDESSLIISNGSFSNAFSATFGSLTKLEITGSDGYFRNLNNSLFSNSGAVTFSDGLFHNESKNFINSGVFSMSKNGVFSNKTDAVFTNNKTLEISGGKFENKGTVKIQESSTFTLSGGEFNQYAGADFENSGSSILSSDFNFFADRNTLVGTINNQNGRIVFTDGLSIKIILDEKFRDFSIVNLEIVLIEGSGVLDDSAGVVLSSISLLWDDASSADSDFVWNKTLENGNLKVVLNSYIPEPSEYAAIFGVLVLLFALGKRRR